MALNIIKCTSRTNTYNIPGRKKTYIAIHYTAGVTSRKGSARSAASWFSNTAAQASADFIVDDEEVIQFNPDIDSVVCWSVGGGSYGNKGGRLYGIATNSNTISIEICSNNKKGNMTYPNDPNYYFTDAAVKNALELTKYLMQKYNIPAERVIRHYDVNGKPCPGIIGWNEESGDESKWKAFKAQLTGTSTATTTASSTKENITAADLEVKPYEKTLYDKLYATLKNHFGVAGMMGNLYAESALSPINLQNSYEKSLGMTDDTYTRFVDGGVYNNFVYDCAGYGLAQWTYFSRKEALLEYSRQKKVSIGDADMQTDFLIIELKQDFKGVYEGLKNAKSVKEASDLVLTQYEKPADQGETMKNKRASYAMCYFNRYAGAGSTATAPAQSNTIKYSTAVKTWQKAMNTGFDLAGTSKALAEDGYFGNASTKFAEDHPLYKGIKGCPTAVKWLQGKLKITKDGSFGNDTQKAVKEYQKKKGLPQTGKCDLKTTKKLLNL